MDRHARVALLHSLLTLALVVDAGGVRSAVRAPGEAPWVAVLVGE
jgi:hypothetical protein